MFKALVLVHAGQHMHGVQEGKPKILKALEFNQNM